jgi:hypothetical protein
MAVFRPVGGLFVDINLALATFVASIAANLFYTGTLVGIHQIAATVFRVVNVI